MLQVSHRETPVSQASEIVKAAVQIYKTAFRHESTTSIKEAYKEA
jgi:hypothetical protein